MQSNPKRAIFPGSFDPFTVGHENIVLRALDLFDEIIVAVGFNSDKHCLFSCEQRVEFINTVFANQPRVSVATYNGLTVDFARQMNCSHILRGLRTSADFEFERAIAQCNRQMTGIDTLFLLTTPEHTCVNSTIVRDILCHGGDASRFLPESIRNHQYIRNMVR
ncbi:MAG: pantetheine-phosphate adenylyltransferase [Bacteroidales bacterium]|nr:pantetheine-phosphate adenylyltransferase [Bacteroidales bacterium]MDD5816080.1 pantetheine-phosphate adenylyltransferase [Bacteroidales bacterium]MDY4519906.1 pantetheine-phosphate adenylyltransferase [Bacteroidales bacterium]